MSRNILIITLVSLAFIFSCSHKSTPTEPQETADLSVNMLLKPARDNGYNVTRVHVKITRKTFVDSMDLTINGESASGTFTDLKVGTYQIEVWVYEDTTLIATGSGTGEVKAGQTVNVTITVTFLTGNLGVTVNWGSTTVEPNTILFEMETGGTVDIQGVSREVNGTINGDYVEWEENLKEFNPGINSLNLLASFPDDINLKFKLYKNGKFLVNAYCTSNNYEHLFTVLSFLRSCSSKNSRTPSEKWTILSYYTKDVPIDLKSLKDLYLRGTPLTIIMSYEYGFFYEKGYIVNGPTHMYDFKALSYKNSNLKVGFNEPIFVVISMLQHQQADFSWFDEHKRNWYKYIIHPNFSVAPKDVWDISFSSKRYFNINIESPQKICIFAIAHNDNGNSSSIKINDNKYVSLTGCCRNSKFDFNIIPSKVEITAYSTWSIIAPRITIITQAANVSVSNWHEERDGVVDPPDSWDQNPKPLILKIDQNGTSIVE